MCEQGQIKRLTMDGWRAAPEGRDIVLLVQFERRWYEVIGIDALTPESANRYLRLRTFGVNGDLRQKSVFLHRQSQVTGVLVKAR